MSEELRKAAIALRDDMLRRAEMNRHLNDGELVVEAGAGVWARFCNALDDRQLNTSHVDDRETPYGDTQEGVTQSDREAAASTWVAMGRYASVENAQIRLGQLDTDPLVQAFRAHRIKHQGKGEREGEKLRIAWWNDMIQRGVSQDVAIAKIRAALRDGEE